MSKNIAQVFATNPITTLSSTYLLYVGQNGVDAAIQVGSIFPSSVTSMAIPVFNGTTGSKFQATTVTIDASNNINGAGKISASDVISALNGSFSALTASSLVATDSLKVLTSTTSGITPTLGGVILSNLTANTMLLSNGSNQVISSALTNGQLFIGSTGLAPVSNVPSASGNISITTGAGTLAFSTTGFANVSFADDTSTPIALVANTGHIANMGSLLTYTLPTICAKGALIYIQGQGAGGWRITQAASQQIQIGSTASTAGVTGTVSSSNRYDSVCLICITANLIFASLGGPQGNLTIA